MRLWTEEDSDRVFELWAEGYNDIEIANEIGSHRSVVGVRRRAMGLATKHNRSITWPDGVVAELRSMWAAGYSASIIGRTLGYTRNAIIGKVYRLGLSGRPTVRRMPHSRRFVVRKRKPKPRPVPKWLKAEMLADPPPSERYSLIDLPENGCHWPVGDPKEAGFGFCGRERADGYSYCPAHCRRAYFTISEYKLRKQAA